MANRRNFKISPTYLGQKIWHEANDGSGSGLDADLLDGLHAATAATGNTVVARDASGHATVAHLVVNDTLTTAATQLVVEQTGDTFGTSRLILTNRTGVRGAAIENVAGEIIELAFSGSASTRIIRMDGDDASWLAGSPSFHIGGDSPDTSPTLAVGDAYARFLRDVQIDQDLTVDGIISGDGSGLTNVAVGVHDHEIEEVNGLSTALDAKANLAGGNTFTGTQTITDILDHNGTSLSFFNVTNATRATATEDIKDALTRYGLLQGTSATPLNLDGGALTGGALSGTTVAASTSATVTRTSLATTSTDGLVVQNTTAATSGTTRQVSPRIRLRGHAWKSATTAASQSHDWIVENTPLNGTSASTSTLRFAHSLAGGSYLDRMTLASDGALVATSFSGDGSAITALHAPYLATGTVPTARLGSGTASSSTFLRGDSTWQSISGLGASLSHADLTNLDYATSGHTGFAGTGVSNTFSAAQTISSSLTATSIIAPTITTAQSVTLAMSPTAASGATAGSGYIQLTAASGGTGGNATMAGGGASTTGGSLYLVGGAASGQGAKINLLGTDRSILIQAGTNDNVDGDCVVRLPGAGYDGKFCIQTLGSTEIFTAQNEYSLSGYLGKISFFGVTPTLRASSTDDIKDALTAYGLLQGTSATDLNLDGGILTAGSINITHNGALAAGAWGAPKQLFRSALVDFTAVADTSILTVPSDHLLLIDSMEMITVTSVSPGTAPTIQVGNTSSADAYVTPRLSVSNAVGVRHVIAVAQDGIPAATEITAGVTAASSAATHSGYFLIIGHLLKVT